MPIISVEIMKTIDERELQKNNRRKTRKGQQETRRAEAIVKVWEPNDFVLHLSQGFSS